MLRLVGCLYYLYQWCTVNQISDNEIYLLIKYIKSVLWRVGKCLSYIEEAWCLKVKVTNTVTLYNLWIPRSDAFNVWRRSSVFISQFPLNYDRWFCFVIPQNTLGFLLHWRHFDTSRLCNCNITINAWHKILETNLRNV